MFVEIFITLPLINGIELGLQDTGGMLKLGCDQKSGPLNHASTRIELVYAWHWNTPRGLGCSNFEAVGIFRENHTVQSKLVVFWKKFAPAVSVILGTILRDT